MSAYRQHHISEEKLTSRWQPSDGYLREIASRFRDRKITVLCGHPHSAGEARISENLLILTSGALDGRPEIQRVLELP